MKNLFFKNLLFLVLLVYSSFGYSESYENPFLKFNSVMLSNTQTLSQAGIILKALAGNGPVSMIPEFPRFTQIRLGLSFNGITLTEQGRTDLALKLGREKIPQIMKALEAKGLLQEAVRLSKIFHIDPLHILGPIIGENTFNGFIDRTIQDHYHQMFQQTDINKMSVNMSRIIQSPNSEKCLKSTISNYWKWRCVIYYSAQSSNNSNGDLIHNFYSITGQGVGSFGIGQMQPFLLWSLNDLVAEKTGYQRFEITNLEKPMKIIFNNKEMLAYIAANAVVSIQVYKLIAGVDISHNPGLTTTLYNIGDEYRKAFYFNNLRMQSTKAVYPQVNYMGWYINTFDQTIRSYLTKYK